MPEQIAENIELDGLKIALVRAGAGTPVLFLHGNGSSWNSWALNLSHLAEGYQGVAIDLPGFGDSDAPSRFFSIPDYAAVCAPLAEGAVLVGNSMGGQIALELAASHPDRVKGLVLVAAPAVARGQVDPALARLLSWVADDGLPRIPDLEELSRISMQADPRVLALANQNLRRARNFLPALPAILNYRWWERVPLVRCPVMLVSGKHDGLLGPDHARRWREAFPQAEAHELEGAHGPHFDAPEVFNQLMRDFLGGL